MLKKKKKLVFFCIKCHLALVTYTHAAVMLPSHEWGVTIMVLENRFFPRTPSRYYYSCFRQSSRRYYLKVVIWILLVAHLRLGRIYVPYPKNSMSLHLSFVRYLHLIHHGTRTWMTT